MLSVMILIHSFATCIMPLLHFEDLSTFDYSFEVIVISLVLYHLFLFNYMLLGMVGGWHLLYGTRAALVTV